MSGANGVNGGQAPTSAGQSSTGNGGQAPTTPTGQQNINAGDTGGTSSTGSGSHDAGDGQQLTLADALKALEAARREAAKNRIEAKELNDLRQFKNEADTAALSEAQKWQKKHDEAAQALNQREAQLKQLQVDMAVERTAARLNIINPAVASKLLDSSLIEFNENGQPKNIEKLLKELLQENPYLATPVSAGNAGVNGVNGTSGTGAPVPPNGYQPLTGGGPTNPPTRGAANQPLSHASILEMAQQRPQEYVQRREEILEYYRAHRNGR